MEDDDPGMLLRMSFMGDSGIGLIQHELLERAISPAAFPYLSLGTVTSERKGILTEWATFNPIRIILRGSENVRTTKCRDCSRDLYSATGDRYIYPSPGEEPAFTSASALIVREDLVNLTILKKLKGFYLERYLVVDTPSDGLGVLDANGPEVVAP